MSFLSTAVRSVLERGAFCVAAAMTPSGPHATPLVFAASGGRLWLTTSRRSVKARAWQRDPVAAGLVRHEDLAVTFTGTVRTYDALDRRTWGAAVAEATTIARATAAFARKNARFFAGYAFDAREVPLAWTPPGRVLVGIDLERTALLDPGGVQEGRGRWGGTPRSRATFRRPPAGDDPLDALPTSVAAAVGRQGEGGLTIVGERGPVVLPARWRVDEHGLWAALPSETLALADAESEAPVALTIDAPSIWRARDMVGALLQGTGSCFVVGMLGSGAGSCERLLRSIDPSADALVRIDPRRVVWWEGWSSGSTARA